MTLFWILVVALLSSQATHALALHKHFGSVRASSFLTLVFIAVTSLIPFPLASTLQTSFLGASFIGMTDPTRLSRTLIFCAAVIYSFIFYFLSELLQGPGGVLGLSAFISCLIVYSFWKLGWHQKIRFRRPDRY